MWLERSDVDAACWTGKSSFQKLLHATTLCQLTISILISFFEKSRANNLVKASPIVDGQGELGSMSRTPMAGFGTAAHNQGPCGIHSPSKALVKIPDGRAKRKRGKSRGQSLYDGSSGLNSSTHSSTASSPVLFISRPRGHRFEICHLPFACNASQASCMGACCLRMTSCLFGHLPPPPQGEERILRTEAAKGLLAKG